MKLSGSAPPGSSTPRAKSPCAAKTSRLRLAARMPAASPSKTTTQRSAKRRIASAWPSVIAVPEVATTLRRPACAAVIRSKYPSTTIPVPSRRIASFARERP